MLKRILSVFTHTFVVLLIFTATASAAEKILPAHSKVYITPMEHSLNDFIQSEIFKQKVPVEIVLKEDKAEFILTGSAVSKIGSEKWYHYLSGTAGTSDSSQATLTLIKKDGESILWSTNAGDRSVWWGMLKKKGERKLAQRLVSKLKTIIIR